MLAQGQGIDDVATAHLSTLSPGVALALHHGGEIVFLESWGLLDRAREEPLQTGTLFPAPGVTPFMIEAVLRALHDAGRIDMDQRLGLLLPDLGTPLAGATLRQLATQTAGLDDAEPQEGWSRQTLLDDVRENWFFTEPGMVVSGSRYSFPVAARVLEMAAGQPLPELLESVLLQPLGMHRSTFDLERARTLGLAPGFRQTTRAETPVEEVEPEEEAGVLPVLFTTVGDLAILFGAWTEGSLRGTSPLDTIDHGLPGPPILENRVLGFERSSYRGTSRLRMSSGGQGSMVSVEMLPEANAVAVAWSPGRLPRRPTSFVLDRMADAAGMPADARSGPPAGEGPPGPADQPPELSASPLSEEDLPELAGTYLNGDRKVELLTSDGRLTFFDGASELELRLDGQRRLVAHIADGRPAFAMEVVRDREGRVYVYRGTRAFRLQEP